MIQPLVFTSKEFANKGLMCNSVLFSMCEGCLVIWENCQILEYLLAWEKCSYIKLLCVPQGLRNVRFCSATCIFSLQQDTIVLKFILNLQWFSQACGARTLAEESANRSEMHARHFPRRCEGWKTDAGRVGDKRESLIYIKRLSMRLFLATWNFATFKGTAGQCSNRCSWDVFIESPADLACTQYANMRTHMPIRMWVNCINASAWASCCSFYCSG